MLSAYSDDRPSPAVGALGALALLILVAGVFVTFQRSGESDVPQVGRPAPAGSSSPATARTTSTSTR